MAGEAEFDEPLPVEGLSHLLQYLDASEVILNQVVVGRENGGDFDLDWYSLETDSQTVDVIAIE